MRTVLVKHLDRIIGRAMRAKVNEEASSSNRAFEIREERRRTNSGPGGSSGPTLRAGKLVNETIWVFSLRISLARALMRLKLAFRRTKPT